MLRLLACITATVAALSSAAPAQAGTATADLDVHGNPRALYTAEPGEPNRITATLRRGGSWEEVVLRDASGADPGAGCRREGSDPNEVVCTAVKLIVRAGDRDDVVDLRGLGLRATLAGGSGDDELYGPDLSSLFIGGPGNDVMVGDDGADRFDEGSSRNGADRITGGGAPRDILGGVDGNGNVVDYGQRRRPVAVDLDGRPDDGERRERDRIASDINALIGGTAADKLLGGSEADSLSGGGGPDLVIGRGGDDSLHAEIDRLLARDYPSRPCPCPGGKSPRLRRAPSARDRLLGGSGQDVLFGASGADALDGGRGNDSITGDGGRDLIRSDDSGVDDVDCGPGRDTARHDAKDFLSGCERESGGFLGVAIPVWWVYQTELGPTAPMFDLELGCQPTGRSTCTGSAALAFRGVEVSRGEFRIPRNSVRHFSFEATGEHGDAFFEREPGFVVSVTTRLARGKTETVVVRHWRDRSATIRSKTSVSAPARVSTAPTPSRAGGQSIN